MHNLEEIIIWKKAIELSKVVYTICNELPSDEKFGMSNQMKRSVISISSNIAEGAGRNSDREFLHFLGISQGSSFELLTQLLLYIELNLADKTKINPIIENLKEIQKMNYAFQKNLKSNL
ncbi:MAG: four helix bundle protein [Moheibacter sp.]